MGDRQQSVVADNFIGMNFIGMNFIGMNFIGMNFIGMNGTDGGAVLILDGLSFNPAHPNGIQVNGVGIDEVALDGLHLNGEGEQAILLGGEMFEDEQIANLLLVLGYAIECALPEGEHVTITIDSDTSVRFNGAMGLAPEWASSALTDQGRRFVSACLAARGNARKKKVRVSIRGGASVATPVERAVYAHHEGAFWGNVFGSDPHMSSCVVSGGGISGRLCTTDECGFIETGHCADVCSNQDPVDGNYDGCNGETAVINTFLPLTTQMANGTEHGCFTDDKDMLWCWGKNGAGQLGDGTTVDRLRPEPRPLDGPRVVELAGGAQHTCARTADGAVYCTGDNAHGQLGIDAAAAGSLVPQEVELLTADTASLSSGKNHVCALKTDGTLHCWGDNLHGQLGVGDTGSRGAPVEVDMLGNRVIRVALGNSADHTCAITTDGSLHCWGWNSAGQLGDGTLDDVSTPVQVELDHQGEIFDEVTDLCTGWLHTCARRADGSVHCFGSNDKGRLGNPQITSELETRPVPVALPGSAIQGGLSCAMDHTCAALDDGSVHCWGGNEYGQLGNGSYDASGSAQPTQVVELPGQAISLSADGFHTCATLADRSVFCWGQDAQDLLFPGTSSPTPVQLERPGVHKHAPAAFTVTFNAKHRLNVGSWSRHLAPNLSHYEIYRNGYLIGLLHGAYEGGADRVLFPGTYCYKMRAVFKNGKRSAFTQEICGQVH